MATNLALDDSLIIEAVKIGKHKSKKDAVNAALKEYILRRKKQEVIEIFRSIVYEPDYDYKKHRSR